MLRHTVWGLKPNFANTVGAGYSLQTGVGTRNGFLKNVVKISIFREKNVCLSYFSRIETQTMWSAHFRVHQLMLVIMYTRYLMHAAQTTTGSDSVHRKAHTISTLN